MTGIVRSIVALVLLVTPLGAVWADHHGGAGEASEAQQAAPAGTVNINTAGAEELQTLPNIGEKKAQAIIDYRTENGAFTSPEDIKNVPGIGEKTFERLQALLTVQ